MAADITMTMDAKLAPAVRAHVKMLQQVQKTENGFKKLTQAAGKSARQIERTGEAGNKGAAGGRAFSASLGSMTSKLAALVGPGAALATFVKLMNSIREEAQAAAQQIQGVHDATAALSQIAQSPEHFEKLALRGEMIALQEGMSQSEALNFVKQAGSAGLSPEQMMQAAKAQRFSAAGGGERFLGGIGKFQSIFGQGAGDARQLISAFLASGGPSDVDADVIAQAATQAAKQAKAIGTSPDELLALMSVLAPKSASPEQAATQIKSLANLLDKAGYGGAGILQGVSAFQADDPAEFERRIKARSEAKGAFVGISDSRRLIGQRIGEVAAARESSALYDEKLRIVGGPRLKESTQARRVAIAQQLSDQQTGRSELTFQNVLGATEVAQEGEGATGAEKFLLKWAAKSLAFFKGSQAGTDYLTGGQDADAVVNNAIHQTMNRLNDTMSDVANSNRAIRDNTLAPIELTPLNGAGNQ